MVETAGVGRVGRLIAAFFAVVLVAAACAGGPEVSTDSELPVIVVTTGIWADVVANVACADQVTIKTLIPRGGDPHAFVSSLADRAEMESAALVVVNGLRLEAGLDDTLGAVEADGTPVLRMAEEVDTIESSALGDPSGAGRDDARDGDDPHVWLDPIRASSALPVLADRLIDEAGLDAAAVSVCLADYRAELARVDAEIGEWMGAIPADRRKMVTNHDSLAYFADRYGLEVVGTVIPSSSSLAATNPAALEELAALIENLGVPVIFTEVQLSTDDAKALAARVGDIELVTLFTAGLGETGSGADTYVGLLRTTARRIADGLG